MVIEIVLATDMSTHFVQIKTMKNMLSLPEGWVLHKTLVFFSGILPEKRISRSNYSMLCKSELSVLSIFPFNSFRIDKNKALCLIVHACDISHPSKPWLLHERWTEGVLEEFFRQGITITLNAPY